MSMWVKPHKFNPIMFQGREQLACKECGYMSDAPIHQVPKE